MTCPLTPIERKVNYAFAVSFILPQSDPAKQTYVAIKIAINHYFRKYSLLFCLTIH